MDEQETPVAFGKCVIERVIGRGARSTVYLAWHEGLQIPVAVKVMKKEANDDDSFTERFAREARIAAQLSHTNIVRVYDCGETEDAFYLVLEYIEGESCRDKLEQWGAFDWQRAPQIIRQVADGLRYAIKKGIIHRDLKPENIMIDSEGNARIADLGLAKEVSRIHASATAEGDVLGTPYYMSPEQVRQPGDVDFRSDIYSLGATLYHMATGEVPFEASTPFEIMTKHLNEPLPPPQSKKPDLPGLLCDIIVRAMAKEPEERYQSYSELIADIDRLLESDQRQEVAEAADGKAGPTESAVVEQETAEAHESREEEEPEPQPIRATCLPVTTQNIQAKLLGIFALLAHGLLVVCIHHLLLWQVGVAAATVGAIGIIGLSAAAAYLALRQGREIESETESDVLDEDFRSALKQFCQRLSLPVPRVHVSDRKDGAFYTYSLFSRRATLDIPGGWLQRVELDGQQRDALIAHGLGGIYTGDSDLRALLAAPLAVLKFGGAAFARLLHVARPMKRPALARLAQVLPLLWFALVCMSVAALFALTVWAGLLGLIFFGLLLLVGGFERFSRHACDAFAAQATGDKDSVTSLIVASALAEPEGYQLIEECSGSETAQRWARAPLLSEERRVVLQCISSYYSGIAYSPGTLGLARKILSTVPFAAERLNQLANLVKEPPRIVRIILFARRAYARLLGDKQPDGMNMLDLAASRSHAAMAGTGGLLVVVATGLLVLLGKSPYAGFAVIMGAAGAALGVATAPGVYRQPVHAGRIGWATLQSSVILTCTAMTAFCLGGRAEISHFALQAPLGLVVVLPLALITAALFVWLAPHFSLPPGNGTQDAEPDAPEALRAILQNSAREEAVPVGDAPRPAEPPEPEDELR